MAAAAAAAAAPWGHCPVGSSGEPGLLQSAASPARLTPNLLPHAQPALKFQEILTEKSKAELFLVAWLAVLCCGTVRL